VVGRHIFRRCFAAVVFAWVVFRIWRVGSRIVNITVGIVGHYWLFGIGQDGRRLWLMEWHEVYGVLVWREELWVLTQSRFRGNCCPGAIGSYCVVQHSKF
jgi:hypothetical protein